MTDNSAGPRTLTEAEVLAIAKAAHAANRSYRVSLGEEPGPEWDEAPPETRDSAVEGVLFLTTTGKSPHFGGAGEAAHNRWMERKLKLGWTWGPNGDNERKTHPCLLPYAALPEEQRRKDKLFIAIVNALDPRMRA